ncbi:UvrD-helicase domain-containing protein [Streptomyces sp. NPDC056600]|uniref:UvrD-helicase domain-containing protein n=1 Tax=Streptomyces sp. NPDC056600 TaxID=3345874 RepID=UPI003690AD80
MSDPRITDPEQLKELLGIPFTPEQLACITAPPAPQVIVAGAGSGKTTVMAARVVWLTGTGQVAPEQVLGLTFTNKAAAELSERVRKALVKAGVTDPDAFEPGAGPEEGAGEPLISTYHSFAGRLLTDHGLRIGLEPSARLLGGAARYQLAARVLREAPGPYPSLTGTFANLIRDLLTLEGELSEHLVTPERLRAYDAELLAELADAKLTNDDLRKVPRAAAARRELAELVGRFRKAKRERDLVDFGDQIGLSAELARGRPEVGALLRDQYRVVLLDEYQDTSVAQRILLSGLFGGGTGHPVTAVGDPCQAIYGWRGASVANLDDFPEHFPHADGTPATRLSLSENRRSGGLLLDLANRMAAPLRDMHEGVEALRPAPGAERDGRVRCALLRTAVEETDWIADSIAHLVATGTPPGEIAVLCRRTADFAPLHAALVSRDVPVEVVGLAGLLDLPEVADLVATCEVLQDPGANASLVRLLAGPRWRIGPRDLALLGRRARLLVARGGHDDEDLERRLVAAVEGTDPAEVISLADALETFVDPSLGGDHDGLPFSAEARVRFARLAAELRDLRRSLSDPLMDVLHRVLAVTGLEVELSASPGALAARRRETLGNFLDTAASFAATATAEDGRATLQAFLGFLRAAAEFEKGLDNALPGGENTVKVLTAHKSKGLEWDVVVVPGLVQGGFPDAKGQDRWTAQGRVLPHALRGDASTLPDIASFDAKGMKAFKAATDEHHRTEELRLGYVTFTRPRSLLLGSGHWWAPARTRPRGPSAFLKALYEHCEAGHGEIEVWADGPEMDEKNPVLHSGGAEHAWPLPLDEEAARRRRAAERTVLAHLERAASGAAEPDEAAHAHHPDWPPPPDDEDLPPDPYDDALPPDPHDDTLLPGPYDHDPVPPDLYDDRDTLPPDPHEHDLPPDPSGRDPQPDPYGGDDLPADRDGDTLPPARPAPFVPHQFAEPLTPEEARAVASWDRDLDALAEELLIARQAVTEVRLPASLTATELMRLHEDPDGFARELARPMPRPPQPAARRGTRFHAWVESRFEALRLPMLEPDELPGTDAEIEDERDLEALKEAFERTEYARRTPYRVEAPFQLGLAGRVVRGRIDAVYRVTEEKEDTEDTEGLEGEEAAAEEVRYEIVDWKTHRAPTADPLQLAVYRLAWAEQQGVPVESVTASFLYVRTGEVVRPADLPGRAELERLLTGDDPEESGEGGAFEAAGVSSSTGSGTPSPHRPTGSAG